MTNPPETLVHWICSFGAPWDGRSLPGIPISLEAWSLDPCYVELLLTEASAALPSPAASNDVQELARRVLQAIRRCPSPPQILVVGWGVIPYNLQYGKEPSGAKWLVENVVNHGKVNKNRSPMSLEMFGKTIRNWSLMVLGLPH